MSSLKKIVTGAICVATGLMISMPVFATEAEEKIATVTETHSTFDAEGETRFFIKEGEAVTVLQVLDDKYEVELAEGWIVHIDAKFLAVEKEEEKVEAAPVVATQSYNSLADQIIAYGKQFIGTPHRMGGTSLTSGVDCSGFTSQVFANFGINLGRSSRDQYSSNGVSVSRANLQPGDLVFYGYSGSVSHVAIYIGNDQILHSSSGNKGVCIAPITSSGMLPIIGYKRVL
ncbi:MAG: hypothetical protein ATN35_07825 [Epulopiscium sp. Nele67-Bin004]|nr:MAG: hypothetical protein ATN35_07825 [Epulopiscium sp. Nele67-Bin004]